jgi:putative holliday junction resolvase
VRVLAVDHGAARMGCAISDPTGTIARPLDVIEPPDPNAVAELVAEHEVELVVVGLPVSLSGAEGQQASEAGAFKDALAEILDVPVKTYDERLTTRLAERSARAGAAAAPDSLAAAHLLESYLAARRSSGGGDPRGTSG